MPARATGTTLPGSFIWFISNYRRLTILTRACYRYDFDLVLGVKPQNPTSSATPSFSYCTEDYVREALGKKIVNLWMEEQELLNSEDVNDYCEHFPTSWTVPASSYADLLEGTTQLGFETCVDRDFMNLFLMNFLDSCNENEESDVECSLTDELVQQCTSSNVAEGNCRKCKAMTVSGVTGCYCNCNEDDSGETMDPVQQKKVFSSTESEIMVIAQFQNYYYADSSYGYDYDYEYRNKDGGGGCWVGEVSERG